MMHRPKRYLSPDDDAAGGKTDDKPAEDVSVEELIADSPLVAGAPDGASDSSALQAKLDSTRAELASLKEQSEAAAAAKPSDDSPKADVEYDDDPAMKHLIAMEKRQAKQLADGFAKIEGRVEHIQTEVDTNKAEQRRVQFGAAAQRWIEKQVKEDAILSKNEAAAIYMKAQVQQWVKGNFNPDADPRQEFDRLAQDTKAHFQDVGPAFAAGTGGAKPGDKPGDKAPKKTKDQLRDDVLTRDRVERETLSAAGSTAPTRDGEPKPPEEAHELLTAFEEEYEKLVGTV